MTLRRLTRDDAQPLRALWSLGLRDQPAAFLRSAAELDAVPDDSFAAGIDSALYLGRFAGDTLIGFVVARAHSFDRLRHTADIGPLFVEPAHHRQGIARALMLACLDHLKTDGLLQAELTVDAANTPAITLYESLGFHTFGRRPRSILLDGAARTDLLMLVALDGADLTGA